MQQPISKLNGSLYLKGFTIYSLPNSADLGISTHGTVCDDGTNQCVLGIFTNQNDFTSGTYSPARFR